MIQQLNDSLNLIALIMVIFGGLLAVKQPQIGNTIVSAGVGMAGGSAVRIAAQRSTDVKKE